MSSPCCPDNSIPPLSKEMTNKNVRNSAGKILKIPCSGDHSSSSFMNVYCAGQQDLSKTQRIVVVFSDVFGYNSGRHFQFADNLAKNSNSIQGEFQDSDFVCTTTVFVPDLFLGNNIINRYEWLGERLSMLLTLPIILYKLRYCQRVFDNLHEIFLPWLQSNVLNTNSNSNDEKSTMKLPVSCVGFCFGAWLVGKCLSDISTYENHNVEWKCGIGIHPSFNVEFIYSEGYNEESLGKLMTQNNNRPFLSLPAKNDAATMKPGGDVIKMLANARKVKESEVSIVMENVNHGYCSQGDGETDPLVKEAQLFAESKAAEFLKKHHPLESDKN